MTRNWSAILIDAGLRNLRVTELALEAGVSVNTASAAAKRYGVRLKGQKDTLPEYITRERVKRHYEQGLASHFPKAAELQEDLNTFCRRVGCSPATALRTASAHNHVFAPSPSQRTQARYARDIATAQANNETLTQFCRRTKKSTSYAMTAAKAMGHTFAPPNTKYSQGKASKAQHPNAASKP